MRSPPAPRRPDTCRRSVAPRSRSDGLLGSRARGPRWPAAAALRFAAARSRRPPSPDGRSGPGCHGPSAPRHPRPCTTPRRESTPRSLGRWGGGRRGAAGWRVARELRAGGRGAARNQRPRQPEQLRGDTRCIGTADPDDAQARMPEQRRDGHDRVECVEHRTATPFSPRAAR